MNYLIMFKKRVVNSVNDYIVEPVNDYIIEPVNDYIIEPVNDYIVEPVITNPINNYIVTPIQHLVSKKELIETLDSSTCTTIDPNIYTTFESYPASNESTSLLEHAELSYTDHLKQSMYYSKMSFKASIYFFINGLFPNTLTDEGYKILENLKKND